MFSPSPRLVAACGIIITLSVGLALGVSSPRSWLLFAAAALIPAGVLMSLANDGPPQTVAEVIRATEDRS